MRIYCMQVRTCPVWNWYGIVEFHLRLQFYSIPFLIETPSLAFSTHSLLKVPNSRIIPTLTFQFQSPAPQVHKLLNSCNSNVLINSSLCFCSPTHNVGNRNELGCCVPELRASKNIYCSQRLHWMGGGGVKGVNDSWEHFNPHFEYSKTKLSGIQSKGIPSWHVRWGGYSEREA